MKSLRIQGWVHFASTVYDADNLDAIIGDAVEREILSNDEVPNAWRDVLACHSGMRMLCQPRPAQLDCLKDTVRRV